MTFKKGASAPWKQVDLAAGATPCQWQAWLVTFFSDEHPLLQIQRIEWLRLHALPALSREELEPINLRSVTHGDVNGLLHLRFLEIA